MRMSARGIGMIYAVMLAQFPLLASGKIDRQSLGALAAQESGEFGIAFHSLLASAHLID
jgi:hypothetical protein